MAEKNEIGTGETILSLAAQALYRHIENKYGKGCEFSMSQLRKSSGLGPEFAKLFSELLNTKVQMCGSHEIAPRKNEMVFKLNE